MEQEQVWKVEWVRGMGRIPPLPPGEVERRRAYIAPFYDHCRAHGISVAWVVRQACQRHPDERPITTSQMGHIRAGRKIAPPWLIADCCRVLGKPVAEVMGAEWVTRFGTAQRDCCPLVRFGHTHLQEKVS